MNLRPAGCGYSIELPDFDFETYSEAGYFFDTSTNRWRPVTSSPPHGLRAVGAAVYSEHPSTEILSVSYNLRNGRGPQLWFPGLPLPVDLFDHIRRGELLEAHNSGFEFFIWTNVCRARMGWPPLSLTQLRCSASKARAHGLPGGLGPVSKALGTPIQKDADGGRLLRKFSVPQSPTKKFPDRRRIFPAEDPADATKLYAYNVDDIRTEAFVSARCPDLSDLELQTWFMDQRINVRGVAVDTTGIENCEEIVRQATVRGCAEAYQITGGVVPELTKVERIKDWIESRGIRVPSLDKEAAAALLKRDDIPADVRRVVELRVELGASSVKKLGAMQRRTCSDGRIRDLFMYCGAERTGRWAGRAVQPQNLFGGGPPVRLCACGRHFKAAVYECPWCGDIDYAYGWPKVKWNHDAARDALEIIATRDLATVEHFFGNAILTVSGCLRALFCAGPGKELIGSDFSAIEAVVLAVLAGDKERIQVFRTHGMDYETTASKITGVPLDEFLRYKEEHKEHHPLRKLGKTAVLASGYQGWVPAWKKFGADKHFDNDEQIKQAVIRWREANPEIAGRKDQYGNIEILGIWGGLENAARAAIREPGQCFRYRFITYGVRDDVLYCQLPSGRKLAYHQPRIVPGTRYGKPVETITFMGWNSQIQQWIRFDTYGGKLTENVTQAIARDIQANAMLRLEAAGYPVVVHVHDEAVSEIPIGYGSIEEYEALMCQLPAWCADWPIRAGGGWRGHRFRKD